MKKAITSFYSVLVTLLMLEFLLTLWSIVFYNSFFTSHVFFTNDNIILRSLILTICALSLGQIYLLHNKGRKLTSISYWLLLGLNSGSSVYLKYSNDIINSNYIKVNAVLFSMSFFTWIMFLLLGVMYKLVFETYFKKQTVALNY